jgi:hypothetical protein
MNAFHESINGIKVVAKEEEPDEEFQSLHHAIQELNTRQQINSMERFNILVYCQSLHYSMYIK